MGFPSLVLTGAAFARLARVQHAAPRVWRRMLGASCCDDRSSERLRSRQGTGYVRKEGTRAVPRQPEGVSGGTRDDCRSSDSAQACSGESVMRRESSRRRRDYKG